MLKRFFLAALLSFCGALLLADRADETKLLKLVPADAEGVLSVDVTDWLTIPAVSRQLKSNSDVAKFRAEFGIAPEDLGAMTGWGKGDDLVLLLAWRRNVTPEQLFKAPRFTCTKVTVDGTVFYDIRKKAGSGKKKVNFWLTVLPGNVFCFVQDSAVGSRYMKVVKGGKTGFSFPPTVSGSLRGVLKKIANRPEMPEGALLGLRVTHGPKAVLDGSVSVTMKSSEEAAQLSAQAQAATNMVLIGAMQDDQDLALDLVRCLKFSASGAVCTLKMKIPGELIEKFGEFAAKQAEQKKAAKAARKAAKPAAKPAKPAVKPAKPAAKPASKPASK